MSVELDPSVQEVNKQQLENPLKSKSIQTAQESASPEQPGVTWGRTASGQVFAVPETHDVIHNLLNPFPPTFSSHNVFELITMAMILWQLGGLAVSLMYYGLGQIPTAIKAYFILVFFLFRCGYNVGLGYILHRQSQDRWLTRLCRDSGVFDKEQASKSAGTKQWYLFFRRQLSLKMGSEYDFDRVPVEFNSWLLYRQLVDFILINDFVGYFVFFASHWNIPSEFGLVEVVKYSIGLALMAFNIWVKVDAHRVVKDFAWYWGDFFFLIDANLTFDGVFEMCFHPMYSVGYIGFYGLSLISNSHIVLFGSLAMHAMQFIFLYGVEEPHIKKTYGSSTDGTHALLKSDPEAYEILYGRDSGYFRRDLIVFKNFDWFRASDLVLAWSVLSTAILMLPFPSWTGMQIPEWFPVVHAVAWRLFHTFGLGWVLFQQSKNKSWTKHFIKFGGTNKDAFFSWKTIYNFSLTMTYTSFIAAAFRLFQNPENWTDFYAGSFAVRQVLGALMVFLHVWMSFSVFDALGDFGWFYGDFFIDEFPAELHYTGIYRYLNNPEKTLGLAAFWGFALMSGSKIMFAVALFSHFANWWFLEYIESPHMKRLYGPKVRQHSGLEKILHKQITEPVKKKFGNVNKVLDEVNKLGNDVQKLVVENVAGRVKDVEKAIERAKPNINEILAGSKSDHSIKINHSDYSLSIIGSRVYTLGDPITIHWTAPDTHSENDWIAVYKITDNQSKLLTSISSKGFWQPVQNTGSSTGDLMFISDKLPWECGVFEFRYHLADKYNVCQRSEPIEIKVDMHPITEESFFLIETDNDISELPKDHPNSFDSIKNAILPYYRKALNNSTYGVNENFAIDGLGGEIEAKKVAYALKQIYGIEFSWKTIMTFEPTAERMIERIQEARITLAPSILEDRLTDSHRKSQALKRQMELIESEREIRGRNRTRSRDSSRDKRPKSFSE